MLTTRDVLDAMYVGGANCKIEDEKITIWREDFKQPTEEAIDAELKKLQAEYDSKQYQRDRAVAYDPIPEQLDQIYHDIDGWKARIKSVKDKYPKP
jgi:hypothetical protein